MTPPSAARDATPRQLLLFSAIFAGVGAQLAWAAHARHPALNVSPALGYVVAAVCLTASAAGVARASGRPRLLEGLVAALLVGLAVVGGWIAIASDGACRTNLPLEGALRAAGCRAAFGLGALITSAMALWALARWWPRRGGPGDGSRA